MIVSRVLPQQLLPVPGCMGSRGRQAAPHRSSAASSSHTWAAWMPRVVRDDDQERKDTMRELHYHKKFYKFKLQFPAKSSYHSWDDVVKHGSMEFAVSVRLRFPTLADKSYIFLLGITSRNFFRCRIWHLEWVGSSTMFTCMCRKKHTWMLQYMFKKTIIDIHSC